MRILSVTGAATVALLLAGVGSDAVAQSRGIRGWAPGSASSRTSGRVTSTNGRATQRVSGIQEGRGKKGKKGKCSHGNGTVSNNASLPAGMCWDRNGDGICDSAQGTMTTAGQQIVLG